MKQISHPTPSISSLVVKRNQMGSMICKYRITGFGFLKRTLKVKSKLDNSQFIYISILQKSKTRSLIFIFELTLPISFVYVVFGSVRKFVQCICTVYLVFTRVKLVTLILQNSFGHHWINNFIDARTWYCVTY